MAITDLPLLLLLQYQSSGIIFDRLWPLSQLVYLRLLSQKFLKSTKAVETANKKIDEVMHLLDLMTTNRMIMLVLVAPIMHLPELRGDKALSLLSRAYATLENGGGIPKMATNAVALGTNALHDLRSPILKKNRPPRLHSQASRTLNLADRECYGSYQRMLRSSQQERLGHNLFTTESRSHCHGHTDILRSQYLQL